MYEDFAPVSDAEVCALLTQTPALSPTAVVQDISERISRARLWGAGQQVPAEGQLSIPVEGGILLADYGAPYPAPSVVALDVEDDCAGLVVLAHGAGSSRNSYRNRYIAARLRIGGYATVRLDLRMSNERESDANGTKSSFDMWTGAARLIAAFDWLNRRGYCGAHAPVMMGASASAAAALCAAALLRNRVSGVIARSGHVDMASPVLQYVQAPVLMIAGGSDRATLARNKSALRHLPSGARLVRVKGAGHTFEEPGALGAVAEHALKWLRALRPNDAPHETAHTTAPFRAVDD
jgi:pimeloyl-ACP methyl ester carboxylesterase